MTDAMFVFLGSISTGEAVGFRKGDAPLDLAVEAWQRGWVRVPEGNPSYANGGLVCAIVVQGLSEAGWRALDAERSLRASRLPMARVRRAFLASGRWALSSVDRILLAALCSEAVFRWCWRLFVEP